jgi:hypothetical protein
MEPLTKSPHGANIRLAKMLINWLNSDKSEHCARIAELIDKLHTLRPPRKNFDGLPQGAKQEKSPAGTRPVFNTPDAIKWFFELQLLNATVREANMFPEFLSPTKTGWLVRWRTDRERTDSDFAAHAFLVTRLAEQGALARVRRCALCNKWFFASRRLDQACCSKSCRKKKYNAKPKVKKQKAKYMKAYMRKLREEGN